MTDSVAAIAGSVVLRWTCNQKVGALTGSNPVTVVLRISVLGIFFHFQDKSLTLPPSGGCF